MPKFEKKQFDNLFVEVYPDRLSAGRAAGLAVAEQLKKLQDLTNL